MNKINTEKFFNNFNLNKNPNPITLNLNEPIKLNLTEHKNIFKLNDKINNNLVNITYNNEIISPVPQLITLKNQNILNTKIEAEAAVTPSALYPISGSAPNPAIPSYPPIPPCSPSLPCTPFPPTGRCHSLEEWVAPPLPASGGVSLGRERGEDGMRGVGGSALATAAHPPATAASHPSSLEGEGDILNNKTINLYSYINILSYFNSKSANNQFNFYNFKKSNNSLINFHDAINIINLTFLSIGCLISKPKFKIVYTIDNLEENYSNSYLSVKNNNKKIIIQLFYYIRFRKRLNKKLSEGRGGSAPAGHSDKNKSTRLLNKNIYQKYWNKINNLTDFLSYIFSCEVELDLIRLNKPYYNSNILVQHLALKSYKNRFVRLVSRLFRKMNIFHNKTKNLNNLRQLYIFNLLDILNINYSNSLDSFPSFVSGIHIKLGGRTFKQKIIPKKTVKQIQKGVLSDEKVKFIEKSRFTGKTRRGSFSFTVILGHIL